MHKPKTVSLRDLSLIFLAVFFFNKIRYTILKFGAKMNPTNFMFISITQFQPMILRDLWSKNFNNWKLFGLIDTLNCLPLSNVLTKNNQSHKIWIHIDFLTTISDDSHLIYFIVNFFNTNSLGFHIKLFIWKSFGFLEVQNTLSNLCMRFFQRRFFSKSK